MEELNQQYALNQQLERRAQTAEAIANRHFIEDDEMEEHLRSLQRRLERANQYLYAFLDILNI